jgi:hypothetical protein
MPRAFFLRPGTDSPQLHAMAAENRAGFVGCSFCGRGADRMSSRRGGSSESDTPGRELAL